MGSLMNQSPEAGGAKRQGHIGGALERCFSEMGRLDAITDQLQQRLEPCCVSATPQPAADRKQEDSGVPLAMELNTLTDRIASLADRISDLTQRVEL